MKHGSKHGGGGASHQKSGGYGGNGGSPGRMGISSKAANGPAKAVGHSIGAQAAKGATTTQNQTGKTAGHYPKSGGKGGMGGGGY